MKHEEGNPIPRSIIKPAVSIMNKSKLNIYAIKNSTAITYKRHRTKATYFLKSMQTVTIIYLYEQFKHEIESQKTRTHVEYKQNNMMHHLGINTNIYYAQDKYQEEKKPTNIKSIKYSHN